MVAVQQADPTGPSRIGLASHASQAANSPTTGLLAIAGPDGVYFADLGRFVLANNASFLSGSSAAGVVAAVLGPRSTETTPYLDVADLGSNELLCGVNANCAASARLAGFQVTAGYVSADTWTLTWQGNLPGFSGPAVLGRDGPGATGGWVAFQVDSGRASPPAVDWFVTARLDRPELGRRVGDFVDVIELVASGAAAACPRLNPAVDADTTTGFTTRIAAVLPSDADHPGGAVRLEALDDCLGGKLCAPATATCPDKLLVGATIRASGLILQGQRFGYAGRPDLDVPFELGWTPEFALAADPERLAIAQKARRRHYPPNLACVFGVDRCNLVPDPDGSAGDPLGNGPMLRFRVRGAGGAVPERGSLIQFRTQDGFAPMQRRPLAAASRPVGLASVFEAPADVGLAERTHFYAAFEDGTVLRIAPGGLATDVVTIR
jgi:hypothetical protein